VLINLAVNARDAMPEGGELRFVLSRVDITADDEPPVNDMPSGRFVRLTVADTGTGMTKEAQEHLFEPFFTTKDVDKGTGLGLAQVYGIVRQHDGHIEVETELGEGTVFRIYLPRTDESPPRRRDAPESDSAPPGRGETILVVENAEEILHAVRDGLTSMDYQVVTAANGREALDIVSAQEVDLVLTDLVMPEMGGEELLRALQAADPQPKAIAMTGYAVNMEAQALRDAGFSGVIAKPFSIQELASLVRATLDARPPHLTDGA
jgi:CheY-like chemotaxis protein